jgi:hypothetical protein
MNDRHEPDSIRRITRVLESRALEKAPRQLDERVGAFLDGRFGRAGAEDPWAGIEFEIARLVSDTERALADAVTRSHGLGFRQVVYRTDDLEVEIQIRETRMAGRVTVMGKVSSRSREDDPDPPASVSVWLQSEGSDLHSVPVDRWSLFSAASVRRGPCRIRVDSGEHRILIPDLHL